MEYQDLAAELNASLLVLLSYPYLGDFMSGDMDEEQFVEKYPLSTHRKIIGKTITECEWFLKHYPRFGINHYPGDKIYVPKDKNVLALLKMAFIVMYEEFKDEMAGMNPRSIQDQENYFNNWFNALGITLKEVEQIISNVRLTNDEL